MLLIAILSLSVVLAVSAEVDVKTKPATLKAVKDSKDSLKTNYDKAHDAMVAKFSKLYESRKNFKAVDVKETMSTTMPYTTTGFIYQNLYFGNGTAPDSTCSSISAVLGYPVNSCVLAHNVAFKFQLTEDSCAGGIVQYFGDEQCTLMLGTSSMDTYMNICEVETANTDYAYAAYESFMCTSSGTPVAPSGAINGLIFPRSTCTGSLYGYYSYAVDVCQPSIDSDDEYMIKFFCDGSIAKVGVWANPTCAGDAEDSEPLPDGCKSVDDDENNDDKFVDDNADDEHADDDEYLPPLINIPPSASQTNFPTASNPPPYTIQFFCPVQTPTLKPAFAPTAFPTSAAATVVSLTLVQKVVGIDSATFNSNAAYTVAFTTTVASTMTGITAANIINIKVSDTRASRRLTGRALSMENAAISVTYTVSATTTSSSDALYYELDSAVSSGAFNTALTSYATVYGADGLEGCTSSSVGTPSSSSKGLSTGAIVGIVIGCVAFVAIVAGLIFFFAMPKKAPMAQAQAELPNKA